MGAVMTDGDSHLIEEDRLRDVSRNVRTYVPSEASAEALPDQLKQFQSLLDDVFYTGSYPSLNGSHRIASWNTLCSLVDQSLESKELAIREYIWSHDVWSRALDLYLDYAQTARPKSSRQLLATLTNALRKQSGYDLTDFKFNAIEKLLLGLLDYEDPQRAKVAAQLLSSLLQKDVISVQLVLERYSQVSTCTMSSTEFPAIQGLLQTVFLWMSKADFGASIAILVSVILDKIEGFTLDGSTSQIVWADPLVASVGHGAVHVDDLRAHLFPVLFKRNFSDFVSFLDSQGLTQAVTAKGDGDESRGDCSGSGTDLLYAALQTGKELGLLYETDSENISYTSSTLLLPLSYIETLLTQGSRSARLTGVYILTTSHSSTRSLSARALKLMQRALATFFADVDADFRSEVFGAFQRLVDRMRSTTKTLNQQSTAPTKQQLLEGVDSLSRATALRDQRNFLRWLSRFLSWELRPTASYQRHISALKCLSILTQSGLDDAVPVKFWSKSALRETRWPFEMKILTPELEALLLDLLLDPFDDVRQTAATVLRFYGLGGTQASTTVETYVHTRERAESKMYLTGRADQADGVAYLYALTAKPQTSAQSVPETLESHVLDEVIQKLENLLAIAQQDLAAAVERYPLHGLLTSLRYIISHSNSQHDEALQTRLFKGLCHVWDLVKPVLCNDAPEGYDPDELEDLRDSTKETLSYCWRALKESSLLLSTIVSMRQRLEESSEGSLLEQMSRLCFTQLAELRHRGAFSTVAQTWTSVCIRCKDLKSADGPPVLDRWYEEVLEMLCTNVTINTRRSAGLPSLLCGILIADKTGSLIARAVTDLETIARQDVDAVAAEEGSLAQVHAMNCQKDMLKNSRLGEQTERYIPASLRLAADALQSDAWAIRNCGLMLFRAVIDRLLGTSEAHFEDDSQITKRISMEQHPQLLDVTLGLLTPPVKEASAPYEGVFPALQMLQLMRVPQDRLAEVCKAVGALTAVPSWHVRDKAARTLASLTSIGELSTKLGDLLEAEDIGENALHGSLLAAKYTLLRTARQSTTHSDVDRSVMVDRCTSVAIATGRLFNYAYSPVAEAAAMGLIQLLSAIDPTYDQQRLMTALWASTAPDGVHGIFRDLLHPRLQDPSEAVVRQAWARLLAQYLSANHREAHEHSSEYLTLIMKLVEQDEDAAKHFLLAVREDGVDTAGPISALVMQLCTDIVNGHLGIGLKCEAQGAILLLSANIAVNTGLSSKGLKVHLPEADCNQRYADQWLQLQSLRLDSEIQEARMDEQMIPDISLWAEECVAGINGHGIHTREAAAEALDRVRTLWLTLHENSALQLQFLRLCIAVYDLLNDDDEDVRLQASHITSRILAASSDRSSARRQSFEFEPIVASQRLLGFCIRRWPASSELIATAFLRTFNIVPGQEPQSFADQLAEALHSNTALFAEEKQNLYIDEAREVRVWSQVVQRLEPKAIPMALIARLGSWVGRGLETLAAHAQINPDGALGWSTNAEVFTLGLQVFYGAEVLLGFAEKGVRIPVRPSEIRRTLFACLAAFEFGGPEGTGQVNCLWRREIERILATSVVRKVKMVGRIVKHVCPHVEQVQ